MVPAVGRLLVATPDLNDPNFRTTVVLLLEHDTDGTLGIVLNRATEVALDDALSEPDDPFDTGAWASRASNPPVIFVGGPVQTNALVALGRTAAAISHERWEPIMNEVGVLSLGGPPLEDLSGLRLFAGYAGWGPGQLDDEIVGGSWFVVDADPDDPFTADPSRLWWRVLRRQGGVFRTATDSPNLN